MDNILTILKSSESINQGHYFYGTLISWVFIYFLINFSSFIYMQLIYSNFTFGGLEHMLIFTLFFSYFRAALKVF